MDKLKPCPFCRKCGADVCFRGAEHQPKATEAWNRRTNNATD